MKNKKKSGHRNKYDSSEDDESEAAAANRRHQKSSGGTGNSRTNSLKRGSGAGNGKQNGRKKHGKSPIPDVQAMHVSDPDDDGINEYYAVRHMDSRQRQQQVSSVVEF